MKSNKFWVTIFILPSIILFIMVFAIPLVRVVATSFTQWTWINKPTFIGFQNYITLITKDSTFKVAFINTIIWVLLQCFIHVSFGVIVAIVLSKKPFGWKIVRTSFLIPNIISAAALGILYKQLLNPKIGLVNSIIRALGYKDFKQNWLGDSDTAFISVTSIWIFYAAVITILVMAEISSIPNSIYESAEVDGATGFYADLYITLPLMRNIIGTSWILAASGMLTQFETIFLTTNGGPGDCTMNLPLYLYKNFNLINDYGMANAIGTIQIILGVASVIIISKLFRVGQSDM